MFENNLEIAGTGCSGIRDNVTDVLNACQVHDKTLKAHTETAVDAAAVSSGVKIPVDAFFVHAHLVHSFDKLVKVLFSLAAAHKLACLGNEEVNCCNGLVVGVNLHVVSLDVLRPICHEYGALEVIYDVLLVFFCNVLAVIGLELPLNVCLLKNVASIPQERNIAIFITVCINAL